MENSSKHIIVRDLTVHYDKKPAVWNVNFSVPKGSSVGVIGPNGAGKTTLIKAMLGIHPPFSGQVKFLGKDFSEMQQQIAYVGQRTSVDWDFPITAIEVVLMGVYGKLGLFRRPSKEDRQRARAILVELGMQGYENRQINDLSGGQKQRLFIGRALMQKAEIYFFDEPFVCIDMTTEKIIVEIFKSLLAEGKTIFVVHHDLNTVEKYFDWTIMMNTRLIANGPTQEVYTVDNLAKAFGERGSIFDEALKLTKMKAEGLE